MESNQEDIDRVFGLLPNDPSANSTNLDSVEDDAGAKNSGEQSGDNVDLEGEDGSTNTKLRRDKDK